MAGARPRVGDPATDVIDETEPPRSSLQDQACAFISLGVLPYISCWKDDETAALYLRTRRRKDWSTPDVWWGSFFRTTVTGPSAHDPTINAAGVDGDTRGHVHNGIVAIVSKSEG